MGGFFIACAAPLSVMNCNEVENAAFYLRFLVWLTASSYQATTSALFAQQTSVD